MTGLTSYFKKLFGFTELKSKCQEKRGIKVFCFMDNCRGLTSVGELLGIYRIL